MLTIYLSYILITIRQMYYSDVAHHPFHQLWNGYSPLYLCDHIVINTPDELETIQPTYKGESFEQILKEEDEE